MYKPPYIVIDFETEENGHGSTEFYRPNFIVSSAAFSWLTKEGAIKSKFILGEANVGYELERIAKGGLPVVAHNIQFEKGVSHCRFPNIKLNWYADTMRLVQVYDNGGDPLAFETIETIDDQLDRLLREATDEDNDEGRPKKGKKKDKPKLVMLAGLGLSKSCKRILQLEDHKKEAHEWLRENVPECKRGRVGAYLNRLPADMLARYNVGDTEATLKLYKFITDHFVTINYNWRFDHEFFLSSVDRIVSAKIEGVPVDRIAIDTYRTSVIAEIAEMGRAFSEKFSEPIRLVERDRMAKCILKPKTLRGRKGRLRRYKRDDPKLVKEVRFNVGSNAQLESLFCRKLGMVAKFKTAKGAPAFRSAVLDQWGDGGAILKARRKRLLVLKQCESLLALTVFDGKWHCDLKACGTSTGRYAGGQH